MIFDIFCFLVLSLKKDEDNFLTKERVQKIYDDHKQEISKEQEDEQTFQATERSQIRTILDAFKDYSPGSDILSR